MVKKQDTTDDVMPPKKSVADDFMPMKLISEEPVAARPKADEPKLDRKAINAALRAPLPDIPSKSGANKPQNPTPTPVKNSPQNKGEGGLRMIPEDPDEEVSRNSSKLASFEQKLTASREEPSQPEQHLKSDSLFTPLGAGEKNGDVGPKSPDKVEEASEAQEADKSASRVSSNSKKSPRLFKKPVPALKTQSVAEASEPAKSGRKVPIKKPKPSTQTKAANRGSGLELLTSFALTAGQMIGAGLALGFGLLVALFGFISSFCSSGKRGGGAQPANMLTTALNLLN